MKTFLYLISCLFSSLILSLILSLCPSLGLATQPSTGKSLEGYETMDMNQFKGLNNVVSKSGSKFKATCANVAGEAIPETDPRFNDCMSRTAMEMKHRKATGEKQSPFPAPASGVTFETDN